MLKSHDMSAATQPTTLPSRIFKSGDSFAVRIPKGMMPAVVPKDADVKHSSGVWTVQPIYKRKLTGLAARFGTYSPGFMSNRREPQEQEQEQDAYDWGLTQLPRQREPIQK